MANPRQRGFPFSLRGFHKCGDSFFNRVFCGPIKPRFARNWCDGSMTLASWPAEIDVSNEKKGPWLVGLYWGWHFLPMLYRDYNIIHYKDPYKPTKNFHGKFRAVFFIRGSLWGECRWWRSGKKAPLSRWSWRKILALSRPRLRIWYFQP